MGMNNEYDHWNDLDRERRERDKWEDAARKAQKERDGAYASRDAWERKYHSVRAEHEQTKKSLGKVIRQRNRMQRQVEKEIERRKFITDRLVEIEDERDQYRVALLEIAVLDNYPMRLEGAPDTAREALSIVDSQGGKVRG